MPKTTHPYRLPYLTLIALCPLLLLFNACSTLNPFAVQKNVIIDWVDFIKFNDITYTNIAFTARETQKPLTSKDLGPLFDTVKFRVSDNVHDPDYKTKNGDAAFLPSGTKIYEVKGYKTTLRLAAYRGTAIIPYQAQDPPKTYQGSAGGDFVRSLIPSWRPVESSNAPPS